MVFCLLIWYLLVVNPIGKFPVSICLRLILTTKDRQKIQATSYSHECVTAAHINHKCITTAHIAHAYREYYPTHEYYYSHTIDNVTLPITIDVFFN